MHRRLLVSKTAVLGFQYLNKYLMWPSGIPTRGLKLFGDTFLATISDTLPKVNVLRLQYSRKYLKRAVESPIL